MFKSIRHKRGVTFRTLVNLPMRPTGWTFTATLDVLGVSQALTASAVAPASLKLLEVTTAAANTASWPLRQMPMQITGTHTASGESFAMETIWIEALEQIT